MIKAHLGQSHEWPGRAQVAALGVSLALHVLILGVIGLGQVDTPLPSPEAIDPLVYIDLEPRPWLPGERGRPVEGPEVRVAGHDGEARSAKAESLKAQARAVLPGRLAEQPVEMAFAGQTTPARTGQDPGWRVAPGGALGSNGPGDVCRDLSNFRAWQAAGCRERGPDRQAEAQGSPPAEIARPQPHRGSVRGEAAQEAFAEQAAANEAWRDYAREGAAYPGLRSLAKHY